MRTHFAKFDPLAPLTVRATFIGVAALLVLAAFLPILSVGAGIVS